jgi:hypothetical protein
MKTTSFKLVLPAIVFVAMALGSLQNSTAKDEYSFVVTNSTPAGITQVLVSEDGKTWGKFNIGSGIAAGATTKLVWDESTNNQGCKQWVKAVFKDGSESKPKVFDFCDTSLVIEFSGK